MGTILLGFANPPYEIKLSPTQKPILNRNFPPKNIIQIPISDSMTSKIIIDNICVQKNPSPFLDNIELDITFTAIQAIPGLLEWKVIYVGSAKDEELDQTLQEFEIGPIPEECTMKFTVDCAAPDYGKIPRDELICVTAIIITISYNQQEFIRVGYYVHNVLDQVLSEEDRAHAPLDTLIKHTKRTILTDKPRITKFRIKWGDECPMKEETNNNQIRAEHSYNSKNSLLGNKMGQDEEKQSTRDEKDQNSTSNIKSSVSGDEPNFKYEQLAE